MKLALVHDYLREYGGAERVVEVLHEIYPDAPLYTSFVDWKSLGDHADRFKDWDIRTSWVQKYYLMKKFISPLRFLAPEIWGSFNLSDYDVVISSSGWFMCRGVRTKIRNPKSEIRNKFQISNDKKINKQKKQDGALHISYIHHPPRNLYGYATGSTLQKYRMVRAYAAVINYFLRQYDFRTAQEVDYFIANSRETARRVEKFYRRESKVIYPPIKVHSSQFKVHRKKERKYFLSVGRLAWAKRVDLIIQACNQLNLPLKIVGTGKEEKYLKSIAGPTIEFTGSVSDKELTGLYSEAKALIFAALDEDFGMVPAEAASYGTPVIGLSQGGVLETVIDGVTGVLFKKPEIKDLKEAINKFNKDYNQDKYYKNCIKQAKKFSQERFKKEIKKFVTTKYKEFSSHKKA